ncbi:phage minor capsid protein [Clostridium sp. BJN0001]|uniref:phage minor capsid protein n=1 Tax=Clostridium sp. BJN0001 TaxID=2930219 RepID=UPI001FD05ED3|nr:phage minor capsid protein [Clostridium sp. BJN0001]
MPKKSYDIRKIFEQMELDLISSMHRTFYFHKREEQKEKFQWEQWQRSKLRSIEEYRKRNKKIVESYSKPIQNCINEQLKASKVSGLNRFNRFLGKVKRFFHIGDKASIYFPEDIKPKNKIDELKATIAKVMHNPVPEDNSFFGINEKKINTLQKVVTEDLKKAQYSVLRRMDDVYRQTIFKSQMYMQAGAKTLNQAIDMATKDFLKQGINSISYKDGKRVNIVNYSEMCLRTANHRTMLLGEGSKRDEWNIHLVVCSAHANTCPLCEPWQGKILIDDVFSHPSKEYIAKYKDKYHLLSEAIKKGLLHPNCRHSLNTYFEKVTTIPNIPDGKKAIETYNAEQIQRRYERQIRIQKRIIEGTCDEKSRADEQRKLKVLEDKLRSHLNTHKELRRNQEREKIDVRSIQEINHNSDLKMYNKFREVLGKDLPDTLQEFQELKYNNNKEFRLMKGYYRGITNGSLTSLADYKLYKYTDKLIKEKLIGIKTSGGIEIKAHSIHFIERIIGSVEQKRCGVEILDIIETLKNPIRIKELRTEDNGISIKYVGENNVVSINPETGTLIQTNPRGGK